MRPAPARRVDDPDELAELFGRHRACHLYGLADLQEPFWSRSRWWRRGDAAVGVLDLPTSDVPGAAGTPAFYAISPADAAGTLALFGEVLDEVPAGAQGSGPLGLHAVVAPRRACDDLGRRTKLRVTTDTLRLPPTPAEVEIVDLDATDHDDVAALHASDPGTVFFLSSMYAGGEHVGARVDGALVAAAGTHVRDAAQRVAAIGAVITHPDHRGRGLAGVVVGQVARRLLASGDTVGLNVRDDNVAARRVYDRLGFRPVHRYEELRLH